MRNYRVTVEIVVAAKDEAQAADEVGGFLSETVEHGDEHNFFSTAVVGEPVEEPE